MKILLVGLPDSVHFARWVSTLVGSHHELLLFPANGAPWHPLLRDIAPSRFRLARRSIRRAALVPTEFGEAAFEKTLRQTADKDIWRARWLAAEVLAFRPDLIHTPEMQRAGYLALAARGLLGQRFPRAFPRWWFSNYGSDILLFGRLPDHQSRVRAVLAGCRYYSCECERDIKLARELGFSGIAFDPVPNGAGIDLERAGRLRSQERPSTRRVIAVKGYMSFAGRALTALAAVERAADALQGLRIVFYSASDDVRIAVALSREKTGLDLSCLEQNASHETMLALHASARASVGVSISDAASTSMLEAMALGSLPIQTNTACCTEWFVDGRGGLVVAPDDVAGIADALARAATDDALVNQAAEENWRAVRDRLDARLVRERILACYAQIERERPAGA